MKKLLLLSIFLVGCAVLHPTTSTPPTPASTELVMARALLDAQTVIEATKALVPANPSLRDPLNLVISAYDQAEVAFLAYHTALAHGGTASPTPIQAQIDILMGQAQALYGLYKGR